MVEFQATTAEALPPAVPGAVTTTCLDLRGTWLIALEGEHDRSTIALIEHDMGVVMDIADRVVVLDHGRKIGDGTPEEVRGNPAVIDAYLGVRH